MTIFSTALRLCAFAAVACTGAALAQGTTPASSPVSPLPPSLSSPSPSASSALPLPPERYNIKQDEASTGSNIPRRVIEGVAIPMNRSWAQLTAEQQALWKSQYEAIAATDEPPFPIDSLGALNRSLTQSLGGQFEAGKLDLNVRVDAEGNATAVSVYATPTPDVARNAARVLMASKFKPAVCSGQPCAMDFPFKANLRKRL